MLLPLLGQFCRNEFADVQPSLPKVAVLAAMMTALFVGREFTSLQLIQNIHPITSPSTCQNHLLCAIQTTDVDVLGSPDGIATAGANILPGAGCFAGDGNAGCASCTAHRDSDTVVFVAVDENVGQVIVQAKLK